MCESWGCSAWRSTGFKETFLQFSVPVGNYRKAGERAFINKCSYRTRSNSFKLKEERFRLDLRRKFFTQRMSHWNRLSRNVVDDLPLGGIQSRIGWGPEQPSLFGGAPANSRRVETRWSLTSLPTEKKKVYDSMCMCYDCGFSFINTLKTDNSFFTLKSKKNSSAYFSKWHCWFHRRHFC